MFHLIENRVEQALPFHSGQGAEIELHPPWKVSWSHPARPEGLDTAGGADQLHLGHLRGRWAELTLLNKASVPTL